ncbi:MAG: rRNA maturation RNase YbeY [Prevotella sp.]|nr:rRNA maturation RNase YbeY [Prevotella sp.]MBP3839328.1 rRNA maturation RNase YbeY [Prevotella sp.]
MIAYYSEGVRIPPMYRRRVNQWIRRIAAKYGKKVGDLNYMFVDDERILKANKKFLKHNYYTDVITFDNSEGNVIQGDIMISVDTVRSNAESLGITFDAELDRVIIHGVLHMCGLKDKTKAEKAQMREAEEHALLLRL